VKAATSIDSYEAGLEEIKIAEEEREKALRDVLQA
jgi:hypothetical protein